jgi:polar amino acid transport system permease protein
MEVLESLGPWLDDFLDGIRMTLIVTALGTVGALVVSFVLGMLARGVARAQRAFARIVIEFFRGTSLLVQLWWLFFALPQLGWKLTPLACAFVAFTLNFGAYGAEVVRGAINAVEETQWDAATALSFTAYQRMRLVILPQAFPGMLPPFGNLLIQLLKSTPLVLTITIADFTAVTEDYRDAEGNTLFIFTLSLVVYFVIAYLFTIGMRFLERRARRGIGRTESGGILRLLLSGPKGGKAA